MDLKSYEIDRFRQLPDIHGALYDAIEEFKLLPSTDILDACVRRLSKITEKSYSTSEQEVKEMAIKKAVARALRKRTETEIICIKKSELSDSEDDDD